jgi:putative photosynthetic complex assembly protein 2
MSQFGYPVLYALFVWWFSTGLIIYLDNLPPRTFRWSMLGGTLVFAVALHRLAATAGDTSVTGAYAAFTYGVLAWGWQEMSFFMGIITGPRKSACPQACSGWRHFWHGVQTSLYHELAIIASALAIVALTWGGANQVGTWTFMVLWAMRQSAKLNVFLGVRNLALEFVPAHLGYLKGFLNRKPMNLLFPVSITTATAVLVILARHALAPDATAFQAAGFTFLCTMLALAIIEHWFLVLPLPFAELWTWVLRLRGAAAPAVAEANAETHGCAHDTRSPLGRSDAATDRKTYKTGAMSAPA